MKFVLIGGHSKGFNEPFHIKTKSGQVLRKILNKTNVNFVLFNLWKNQKEEDSRKLSKETKIKLNKFINKKYKLIALGRYIEKSLKDNNYQCNYLPHPASRDYKYIKILEKELLNLK